MPPFPRGQNPGSPRLWQSPFAVESLPENWDWTMRIRRKSKQSSGERFLPACTRRRESGYTFTEVLVAAGILGLVATTIYAAFAVGFCVIQSTRENLRATQIMVQKMEGIRLLTWSQIADTNRYLPPFTERYDPLGATTNAGGAQYTGYVRSSIPTSADLGGADYQTNMRTITVTVYWTNFNRAKRIVHKCEMQTRVARNGLQNYIWGSQ